MFAPPQVMRASPASRLQNRLLALADDALVKGDISRFESLFDKATKLMELRRAPSADVADDVARELRAALGAAICPRPLQRLVGHRRMDYHPCGLGH